MACDRWLVAALNRPALQRRLLKNSHSFMRAGSPFAIRLAMRTRVCLSMILANDWRPTTDDALLACDRRLATGDFLQIRHLHCGERRFESFIPHLQSRAIDCLLERVASEHAEGMGHSRFLRRLPNPTSAFIHDHVVMGGIAAQETTQADDRIVFAG